MPLKFAKLGSSDLTVPNICLGTMTWGRQNTEEEAFQQLDYALERGINFIDTAEMYPVPPGPEHVTATEKIIGRWLASRQNRDKVILATKVAAHLPGVDRAFVVAARSDPPADPATVGQPRLDRANVRQALEASLRRLQTSYVDLYQLHWPDRYAPVFGKRQYRVDKEHDLGAPIEETVAAIGELIREGKIRHWGLSNETTFGVCQFAEAARRQGVPLPVSIQNDYSLVYRHFDDEVAEACSPKNYNIGLLAYGALAGGTLSGKYLDGAKPQGARHTLFPEFQPRYVAPRTNDAAGEYAALAQRKGLTPTQLSLAWAASRWHMASVIIGATTLAQLKENIDAFDVELDQDTLDEIEAIHLRRRNPNAMD